MIESNNKKVIVKGNPIEIIQDFVNITQVVRNVSTDNIGKEKADEIISL